MYLVEKNLKYIADSWQMEISFLVLSQLLNWQRDKDQCFITEIWNFLLDKSFEKAEVV